MPAALASAIFRFWQTPTKEAARKKPSAVTESSPPARPLDAHGGSSNASCRQARPARLERPTRPPDHRRELVGASIEELPRD
jgi:hypothetical protein